MMTVTAITRPLAARPLHQVGQLGWRAANRCGKHAPATGRIGASGSHGGGGGLREKPFKWRSLPSALVWSRVWNEVSAGARRADNSSRRSPTAAIVPLNHPVAVDRARTPRVPARRLFFFWFNKQTMLQYSTKASKLPTPRSVCSLSAPAFAHR